MTRLNTTTRRTAPTTHEGAAAATLTPEQELRRSVMACLLWEDTFYEQGETVAQRIERLVSLVPPALVAALAIEAREDMHLRHVPLWLARALAFGDAGRRRHVAAVLERVVQRPDELTELLAMYWKGGKRPLAAQVKKGLGYALKQFNEYALAKYNRKDPVRLRDVLFLTHP